MGTRSAVQGNERQGGTAGMGGHRGKVKKKGEKKKERPKIMSLNLVRFHQTLFLFRTTYRKPVKQAKFTLACSPCPQLFHF